MIKDSFQKKITALQARIVEAFKGEDAALIITRDDWERPGGGGGHSNVLSGGNVIEKGGVNVSMVNGQLPEEMRAKFNAVSNDFYAAGISLVIHPYSPFVPTVHFNIRQFELYKDGEKIDGWFGGGMDLTPYYIFEEDAIHFHKVIKSTCDTFDKSLYPEYKQKCDDYFYNSHRKEHRGIGGIFFDYLKGKEQFHYDFTTAVGDAFLDAYLPILQKRKGMEFSDAHKEWQEIRRGRYVEFNLIHDRGTLFGLRTNGRTESILMSLPPTVQWKYDHHPEPNSEEAKLLEALKPQDWVAKI